MYRPSNSNAMHTMSVKRSQIFKTLACCHILAAGTTCLPNAIPEDQRQNITIDGVSMPLGIVVVDSCLLSGKVLNGLVMGRTFQTDLKHAEPK